MESRMNLIDELSIELGDLAYRQSGNWKAQHNLKFIDVMVEMKRFLVDWKATGKIKTRRRFVNILYPYFANRNKNDIYPTAVRYKFKNKEWFVRTMKKEIGEWLDKMTGGNSGSVNYSPLYPHKEMLRAKYFELLDEWQPRNWKSDGVNYTDNPYELSILFSNLNQWVLLGNDLTNDHMKITHHFTTIVPPIPGVNNGSRKVDYTAINKHEATNNLYLPLWTRFHQHHRTKWTENYHISIKLDEGKRMNYTTTPIGLYSILNWKKTMKNGNCSNKDLKAIHHYYYKDGYGTEKKERWVFGGITANQAVLIANLNEKPKTDKKATYEDIKMWWYKLEA